MGRVLIYGGSFDPIHQGHLRAIQTAVRATKADKLVIVPANLAPLKERALSPAADRIAMIKIGMKALKGIKYEISDYELKKGGVSYSYETIRHFKSKHPQEEFYLLIGTDQANQFDLWKNAHLICKMCQIVCVRRTTFIDRKILDQFSMRLLPGKQVFATSTELRSRVDKRMALPGVTAYVNQHLLYLNERVKK